VGHHVSAIVIQAQAGRALAASNPDRALATLETIEDTASRTLEEMRAMVGLLRDGADPDFAPQPGLADIQQLARSVGGWPRVHVQVAGDFAKLSPGVGVALYRIAQEAVTNAVRHARDSTRITVHLADEDEQVRLTVRDDGAANGTGRTPPGYGLVGMAERASLLGGTLQAGPDPDGGWTVDAVLPKGVATP
jgi:signal transduction histidine kinase